MFFPRSAPKSLTLLYTVISFHDLIQLSRQRVTEIFQFVIQHVGQGEFPLYKLHTHSLRKLRDSRDSPTRITNRHIDFENQQSNFSSTVHSQDEVPLLWQAPGPSSEIWW